jgi:hypothetical protein
LSVAFKPFVLRVIFPSVVAPKKHSGRILSSYFKDLEFESCYWQWAGEKEKMIIKEKNNIT